MRTDQKAGEKQSPLNELSLLGSSLCFYKSLKEAKVPDGSERVVFTFLKDLPVTDLFLSSPVWGPALLGHNLPNSLILTSLPHLVYPPLSFE